MGLDPSQLQVSPVVFIFLCILPEIKLTSPLAEKEIVKCVSNVLLSWLAFGYVWGCIMLYIDYIQPNQYKLTLWLGPGPKPPFKIIFHKSVKSQKFWWVILQFYSMLLHLKFTLKNVDFICFNSHIYVINNCQNEYIIQMSWTFIPSMESYRSPENKFRASLKKKITFEGGELKSFSEFKFQPFHYYSVAQIQTIYFFQYPCH